MTDDEDSQQNSKIGDITWLKEHGLNFDILPDDLAVSTMTALCRLDTPDKNIIVFNVENIGRFFELEENKIITVKYGYANETNRSLIALKNKATEQAVRKSFFNQVTIVAQASNKKNINYKFFTNGFIHITGCKDILMTIKTLDEIFVRMKKIRAILCDGVIVEKPFITKEKYVDIHNVKDFSIAMINSNFDAEFMIDRTKLFNIMSASKEYNVSYDPSNHACVDVKYTSDGRIISIFVFEKGPVVITGAKNCDHIVDAYYFINKILLTNYDKIVKKKINVKKLVKEMLKK